MKQLFSLMIACLVLMVSTTATAAPPGLTGFYSSYVLQGSQISLTTFKVAGAGTYSNVIRLNPVSPTCSNGPFLPESAGEYASHLGILLDAKIKNRQVQVYSVYDSSFPSVSNCKITLIRVLGY